MSNKLTVTGKQDFMGIEIPVVLGGFGPKERCICDKTAAKIHGMETFKIRERITENIERFDEYVDYIDLKIVIRRKDDFTICSQLGYSRMEMSKAENIYVLSRRGYFKLVKILKTDEAWDVYNQLLDSYFIMEEKTSPKIDSSKQARAEAMLRNSRARSASLWLKLADRVDIPEYKQICASYASGELAGREVIPLPKSEQHYYSATEMGEMLGGIDKARVGKLANTHRLKTEEYGKWFHDKSPYSAKEVDTFKYNDKAVQRFREILGLSEVGA